MFNRKIRVRAMIFRNSMWDTHAQTYVITKKEAEAKCADWLDEMHGPGDRKEVNGQSVFLYKRGQSHAFFTVEIIET